MMDGGVDTPFAVHHPPSAITTLTDRTKYRLFISFAIVAFAVGGLLAYSYATDDWRIVRAITAGPKKLLGIKEAPQPKHPVSVVKPITLPPSGAVVVTADVADVSIQTGSVTSLEVSYVADTTNGEHYNIQADIVNDTLRVVVKPDEKFIVPPFARARVVLTSSNISSLSLTTQTGSAMVTGLSGPVQLTTTKGNIVLNDVNGPMTLSTKSGNIRLERCRPKAELQVVGGTISSEGFIGELSATATSDITVTQHQGTLTAKSSHGNVSADFRDQRPSCIVSADTGNITLRLLPNARVSISAISSIARIMNTLELDSVPASVVNDPTKLRTTMNGGGAIITAHSKLGSVSLREYGER